MQQFKQLYNYDWNEVDAVPIAQYIVINEWLDRLITSLVKDREKWEAETTFFSTKINSENTGSYTILSLISREACKKWPRQMILH